MVVGGGVRIPMEIGAIGFVFPTVRVYAAAGILTMQAGIWVLLGYFEPEWYLVVGALLLLAN